MNAKIKQLESRISLLESALSKDQKIRALRKAIKQLEGVRENFELVPLKTESVAHTQMLLQSFGSDLRKVSNNLRKVLASMELSSSTLESAHKTN